MIINARFLNKILVHTMMCIQVGMDFVPSEMQVDLFQLSCKSIFKEPYRVVKDVEASYAIVARPKTGWSQQSSL
jgi:hypothetical protein